MRGLRELEVVNPLARGLSNAEPAADTDVARVLMRLGVRDRVQAVAE